MKRTLPFVTVAGVTAFFVALAVREPPRDGDPYWQRWLGEQILHEHAIPRKLGAETFTAAGATWTPQEWAYSLLLAFTGDHGAAFLMPAVCGIAAGVALLAVALRCRGRGIPDVLTTAAVVVGMLAMLQAFGPRPQVFGWAAVSLMLWLLEGGDTAVWMCVPLTVVWANLHASVFLAPVLAGVFALTAPATDRLRGTAVALACAAATLATPLGIDLPGYAARLLISPIRASIAEWGPASAASGSFLLGALPLVVLLAAFGARLGWRDRILTCGFLTMMLFAVRNVPLFALAIGPVALGSLPRRETRSERFSGHAGSLTTLATAAAFGAIAVAAWVRAPELEPVPYRLAATLLAQTTVRPRVFCEDFAWCSMFLRDDPSATVFIDGRADPYPVNVWREYRAVVDGRNAWASILAAHRVDAVLVRRDSALDSLLADNPRLWASVGEEQRARLYVRSQILTLHLHFVNASTTRRFGSMEPWKT